MTGDAKFSVIQCENGCDNCNIFGEFGVTYKPKSKPEKEISLCHKCLIAFIRAAYHAGLLD